MLAAENGVGMWWRSSSEYEVFLLLSRWAHSKKKYGPDWREWGNGDEKDSWMNLDALFDVDEGEGEK